jgi:HD-GYP domain-containing protein (c-di-GMP phosphodiesterase class II)
MAQIELERATYNDQIRSLLRDMEEHHLGEAGHAERVAVMAVAIGEKLGLSDEELLHLRWAAALHDVGKIAVSRDLLQKIDQLSPGELTELRMHAHRSKKIVDSLPWLQPCLPMIIHHHECWDGTGYPDGLAGDAIPLGSRIIAVAEVFDTLTSAVPWRRQLDDKSAMYELRRCAGTQFQPEIVDAFASVQPLIQPVRL